MWYLGKEGSSGQVRALKDKGVLLHHFPKLCASYIMGDLGVF